MLSSLVRMYLSKFPIEKGKWHLWMAAKNNFLQIPEASFEAEIKFGLKMRLNTREKIDQFIYFWGCWEPNETWAIQKLLKPGDTFVDVGANIGYFTLLAAKIVGERGKVFAFEPVPPTYEKLCHNVGLNNFRNVTTFPNAVSDREGTVTISQAIEGNPGMNSMRLQEGQGTGVSWDIPAKKLDEILKDIGPIQLLKIDVEGAEHMALKGFESHLRADDAPSIICEITDRYLKDLGSSAVELIAYLKQFRYKGYLIEDAKFRPIDLENFVISEGDAPNILFSKQESIPH